jgi:hypothetical protein
MREEFFQGQVTDVTGDSVLASIMDGEGREFVAELPVSLFEEVGMRPFIGLPFTLVESERVQPANSQTEPAAEPPKRSMPVEGERHQCALLEYHNRCLEYCCAGKDNARWRLLIPADATGNDDDEVVISNVLFCPCCGKDLRADTGTRAAGDVVRSKLLREAGCTGPSQ